MPKTEGGPRIFNLASEVTGTLSLTHVDTSTLVIDGDAAGGHLAGTYPNPTVANFTATTSYDTNGYHKFPNGFIIQWGEADNGQDTETVTFPLAFPTTCYQVVGCAGADPGNANVGCWDISASTFDCKHAAAERPLRWMAFGY